MVYRVFVEKKPELAHEAKALLSEAKELIGIASLENVRIINRYDAENISEELFSYAEKTVFSEPQLDIVSHEIDMSGAVCFAVEYLPGQFDQRADSAAQCIQIISKSERPVIRTAKVYMLYGKLSDSDVDTIKKYVINPVEAREASFALPETLRVNYEIPTTVKTLEGFCSLSREGLLDFIKEYGLAMDIDDISFCQSYFRGEKREPTITEIKMIDTYWVYVLPYLASTMGVFLMKQYMEGSVPDALLEAARIDGAGYFRTFWEIVFPMVKPCCMTLTLFAFRDVWSGVPGGTIFSEALKTLPAIMTQITAGGIARAGSAMAVTVIMMLPPILVYMISQSNVLESMNSAGIKE